MKIATWNVNSIHAREDQILDWLEQQQPDVLCLQETKTTDQEFPEDGIGDLGYDFVYTGQRSYNGVAILAKDELTQVKKGLPDDDDASDKRFIAATINGVRIISVYVPNGQDLSSDKYPYKLDWLARLRAYLDASEDPKSPLIMCGDYNICPHDQDAWDAAERPNDLFSSPPERAAFQRLLDWGLTDSFYHLHPEPKNYTWWDYRGGSWERNRGLRIDHLLVTQPILAKVKEVTIHRKVRANPAPSDHVPVLLELNP